MTDPKSTLDIKALFADDGAVSPVIGVILMVAITVILAAVIGTFVLGLGQNVQQTAPQASFSMQVTQDGNFVEATHDGGDAIGSADLNVSASTTIENASGTSASGTSLTWDELGTSGDVTAGTMVNVTATSGDLKGETIRVVWNSPDSDKSQTLRKFDVPA